MVPCPCLCSMGREVIAAANLFIHIVVKYSNSKKCLVKCKRTTSVLQYRMSEWGHPPLLLLYSRRRRGLVFYWVLCCMASVNTIYRRSCTTSGSMAPLPHRIVGWVITFDEMFSSHIYFTLFAIAVFNSKREKNATYSISVTRCQQWHRSMKLIDCIGKLLLILSTIIFFSHNFNMWA